MPRTTYITLLPFLLSLVVPAWSCVREAKEQDSRYAHLVFRVEQLKAGDRQAVDGAQLRLYRGEFDLRFSQPWAMGTSSADGTCEFRIEVDETYLVDVSYGVGVTEIVRHVSKELLVSQSGTVHVSGDSALEEHGVVEVLLPEGMARFQFDEDPVVAKRYGSGFAVASPESLPESMPTKLPPRSYVLWTPGSYSVVSVAAGRTYCLGLYDLSGRLVARVADGQPVEAVRFTETTCLLRHREE